MTTADYLPIELDLQPEPGLTTTFGIYPGARSVERLDVCGLALFHELGEVELVDISLGDHSLLIGPVDASAYNPYRHLDTPKADDGGESEEGDDDPTELDPRFCIFQPGIISQHRPLMMTIRSEGVRLRGRLYGKRVLDGGHLLTGVEKWREDPEFQRFVDLAFDRRPTAASLELMYHGWLGRARSGL